MAVLSPTNCTAATVGLQFCQWQCNPTTSYAYQWECANDGDFICEIVVNGECVYTNVTPMLHLQTLHTKSAKNIKSGRSWQQRKNSWYMVI